jgi:integrase
MTITQSEKINTIKPDLFRRMAKSLQSGKSPLAKKLQMNELFDNWLTSIQLSIKKTTFSTYLSIIDNHLRPYLGEIAVNELTDSDIASLMTEKCSESSNLSKSTVRGIASVLKSIIEYGKDFGCNVHPETCKFSQKTRKTGINVLTDDEQERLCWILGDCPKGKDLGVLLCLKTGLRVGEICALKWDDISLSGGYMSVNRTIQRIKRTDESNDKTILYFGEPKSLNSRRKIPLSQSMIDILDRRQLPNDYFVVSGRRDKTVEPRSMQRHFKKLLKDAGIRDLNFHVLRHTFATKCVERGFDVKSLSMILGHSDVNITMNVYVHPSFERLQDMMALLD